MSVSLKIKKWVGKHCVSDNVNFGVNKNLDHGHPYIFSSYINLYSFYGKQEKHYIIRNYMNI